MLDAVYGRDTLLLRAARERGCRIIPGESWLLNQGSEAFLHLTERPLSVEALGGSLTRNDTPSRDLVTLIGAMGSGKSTVGKLVAKELDWPFLDLDEEIQAK